MIFFVHLRVLEKHPMGYHIGLGIIKLLIWVVIHLELVMLMVTVMWVLIPLKFTPQKLIFGLMVMIFVISEYLLFIHEPFQQRQVL